MGATSIALILPQGSQSKFSIEVGGDRPNRMPRVVEAAEFVQAYDLSPDGKRASFSARGDIFTVPAEHGPIRNITRTPEAREISATWSPDGSQLAYLSDATGEYELWLVGQKGNGETSADHAQRTDLALCTGLVAGR